MPSVAFQANLCYLPIAVLVEEVLKPSSTFCRSSDALFLPHPLVRCERIFCASEKIDGHVVPRGLRQQQFAEKRPYGKGIGI